MDSVPQYKLCFFKSISEICTFATDKKTNKQIQTKFCYQFLIRKRDYETFACLYAYVLHAHLVLTEVRRGCQLPWSWVTDNWEPPCGCNKQNKAPLQKH